MVWETKEIGDNASKTEIVLQKMQKASGLYYEYDKNVCK